MSLAVQGCEEVGAAFRRRVNGGRPGRARPRDCSSPWRLTLTVRRSSWGGIPPSAAATWPARKTAIGAGQAEGLDLAEDSDPEAVLLDHGGGGYCRARGHQEDQSERPDPGRTAFRHRLARGAAVSFAFFVLAPALRLKHRLGCCCELHATASRGWR